MAEPQVANAEVEEEEAGDFDDPLAMLGGMGEEEVYKVTLMDDQAVPSTNKEESVEDDAVASAKGKKNKKGKSKKKTEVDDSEALVALLDDKGDATRSFKQCLVELFKRFDVDKDNLLSDAELKAFSREANPDEREFTVEEMDEIREFFDWKESGSAGVAGLTLRGWLQMYVTQTAADEAETWKDLRQLGYNGDLQLTKGEGKRPRSASLCAALERFVALGEAGDVDAFVKAFVATDIDEEDRAAFSSDLQKDGGEQLKSLMGELRCCATGQGVFMVEEKKKGPVTIHFHSPAPGAERVDRAVTFIRDGNDWRAEG